MVLAQLPPTLRKLGCDSCHDDGEIAEVPELTDDDIVQLVGHQTNLRCLHLVVRVPMLTVAALVSVGRHCRQLRYLNVSGAFQLDKLATPTNCVTATSTSTCRDNTNKAVTSAMSALSVAPPRDVHANDSPPPSSASAGMPAPMASTASTGPVTYAVEVHGPLFPELRTLILDNTLPTEEGVPWSAMSQALENARKDDFPRIKAELFREANEAAAERTVAHVTNQAPRLEDLLLVCQHGVNDCINKLWRQMHPGGCATCGLHDNWKHD
jgi:hypothetical protein